MATPEELFPERRRLIVEVMKAGGYWDKIFSGGQDLSRVQEFLGAFAGEAPEPPRQPLQAPRFFPMFPGLRHKTFYDRSYLKQLQALEQATESITREARALSQEEHYLNYPARIQESGRWTAYPFYYMGVRLDPFCEACPETSRVLDSLSNDCYLYPWADVLFSSHDPGTHLVPHCSVDNLRLRCHLGLQIPAGCQIRVCSETRTWEPGKTLIFDESFEHEVWNKGTGRRIILILDFWHPDLTAIEREALLAGFRKAEVRRHLYDFRLGEAMAYRDYLLQTFQEEENDPLITNYWS